MRTLKLFLHERGQPARDFCWSRLNEPLKGRVVRDVHRFTACEPYLIVHDCDFAFKVRLHRRVRLDALVAISSIHCRLEFNLGLVGRCAPHAPAFVLLAPRHAPYHALFAHVQGRDIVGSRLCLGVPELTIGVLVDARRRLVRL